MKKYFSVTAKGGHVTRNYFIPITLYFEAASAKEAASMARKAPRVKHNHSDAVLNVNEVSVDQYIKGKSLQKNDPYFRAKNIQEQRQFLIDIEERIVREKSIQKNYISAKSQSLLINKKIYDGKVLIKHPQKYFRFYELI